MKTYTEIQFSEQIQKSWHQHDTYESTMEQIQFFIGGEIIEEHHFNIPKSHDVFFGIIEDPTHKINSGQLCQIFDEGNHCLSEGSIVYEYGYAYITWSNYGHI